MNDLVTDIAELEENACRVDADGKESLGVLFEDWNDAWGFCRAGSVTGALDDHPPVVVYLERPVEIDGTMHYAAILLYWPRVRWNREAEQAFPSAQTIVLE